MHPETPQDVHKLCSNLQYVAIIGIQEALLIPAYTSSHNGTEFYQFTVFFQILI
jgi:hypothetical protein